MRVRSRVAGVYGGLRLCWATLLAMVASGAAASGARGQVDFTTLRTWGLETYLETDRTLRVPGTQLFAETASLSGARSGGFNGRAFVWPESTQFRVFNTLTQIAP